MHQQLHYHHHLQWSKRMYHANSFVDAAHSVCSSICQYLTKMHSKMIMLIITTIIYMYIMDQPLDTAVCMLQFHRFFYYACCRLSGRCFLLTIMSTLSFPIVQRKKPSCRSQCYINKAVASISHHGVIITTCIALAGWWCISIGDWYTASCCM